MRGVLCAFGATVAFVCSLTSANARDSYMKVGLAIKSPIGYTVFCTNNPVDCAKFDVSSPMKLDPVLMNLVARLNTSVNLKIKARSDAEIYGVPEYWTYPDGAGDCEDYVLEKRRLLHQAGIALSNLLITVVRQANGEGHAVLTLRTDGGDFILDNLDWRVKHWSDTPYVYLKRQSETDPNHWQAIEDGQQVTVSASVAR
ncbi:Predicted transglutaminase-like cysteine proteinase [Consotaella salsifontis]|uniref:Predicted transglutaminase-like cysteine proteinase n=2 Tax=Consotaella salsifontis TaxID=1365950 RepID=A0A1T4QVI7_9HYPH|nr:Predicted transglutaminase-like cysteine proteinase [Consotaella salsifontis]